jgi:hypothetical protein
MWEGVQVTGFDPEKRAAFSDQKLVMSTDDYLSSRFVLWFYRNITDHETFAKAVVEEIAGIYPGLEDVIHLVVAVHNKRLKMTDLVLHQPIRSASDIPMFVNLHEIGADNRRPRPLQTPGDGCEISVEFLLGRDLSNRERQPFRAWRKGSWLARVAIGIATSGALSGPQPLPLTDSVRTAKSVPPEALHYIDFVLTGPSLLSAETFDEVLQFYVDEEVLQSVMENPLGGWSQRIQIGWILDVAKTFVLVALRTEGFDDFDPDAAPWSGSVLRAILDKAMESPGVETAQDALELLRDEPGRFFALLEDRAGLLDLERELVLLAVDGGAQ